MTLKDMNIVCAFYRSIVYEQRLLAALRRLEKSLQVAHALPTP